MKWDDKLTLLQKGYGCKYKNVTSLPSTTPISIHP